MDEPSASADLVRAIVDDSALAASALVAADGLHGPWGRAGAAQLADAQPARRHREGRDRKDAPRVGQIGRARADLFDLFGLVGGGVELRLDFVVVRDVQLWGVCSIRSSESTRKKMIERPARAN